MSGTTLNPAQQWFDNNGNPLSAGKIYTYIANTSTPKNTYSDYALSSVNTNPVILDSAGRAQIWGSGRYKIVVKTSADVTLYTQDNIFLSGSDVEGGITVSGTSTFSNGGFIVNYTTATQPYPVQFYHSNVYSNLDTYGSGALQIEAKGENNNQPIFVVKYHVTSTSLGNVGPIIWNDGGTSYTTASVFASTIEMLSPNTKHNAYNGKWEIGTVSGRNTGTVQTQDGYFYIAPRRGPEHPSGENSGFQPMTLFYPNTSVGKGEIEHRGLGLSITPAYDHGSNSFLTVDNAFTSTIITNQSTTSTGFARIENSGYAASYIRSRARNNTAAMYIQSDNTSSTSFLEIRSNWENTGTASALINLFTNNNSTGFRLQSNGVNGRFNIRYISTGSIFETIDIVPSDDGLVNFYRHSDYTQGRIKLGSGAGANGGGVVSYNSNNGIYDLTGTNGYMTFGSSGIVEPTRLETVEPTDGNTVYPSTATTDYLILGGTFTNLTIQLPATPPNLHKLTVMTVNGITNATVSVSTGTIVGAPTSTSQNGFFTMIFRQATNTWYRNG